MPACDTRLMTACIGWACQPLPYFAMWNGPGEMSVALLRCQASSRRVPVAMWCPQWFRRWVEDKQLTPCGPPSPQTIASDTAPNQHRVPCAAAHHPLWRFEALLPFKHNPRLRTGMRMDPAGHAGSESGFHEGGSVRSRGQSVNGPTLDTWRPLATRHFWSRTPTSHARSLPMTLPYAYALIVSRTGRPNGRSSSVRYRSTLTVSRRHAFLRAAPRW